MADINVVAARTHNLRAINLRLPLGCLVAFCGVSGSGKSSLLLDTIHAESQRRYLTALGASVRWAPPPVDRLEGMPPSIALPQRGAPIGTGTTFGEVAGIAGLWHTLLGRGGTFHCPTCARALITSTHDQVVAELAELPAGTRLLLEAPWRAGGAGEVLAAAGFSRARLGGEVVRVEDLGGRTPERVVVDRLKAKPDTAFRARLHDSVRLAAQTGGGVLVAVCGEEERAFLDRPVCVHCDKEWPALEPSLLRRGEGGSVRWGGRSAEDWLSSPTEDWQLPEPTSPVERALVPQLASAAVLLADLGLGHLPLNRHATEVSAGELQRARLAAATADPLAGVLYLLDEPAAGLSEAAAERVVAHLRSLANRGNSVFVTTHLPTVLKAADHIVELGPGAGEEGGEVVFEGSWTDLVAAETATSAALSSRPEVPVSVTTPSSASYGAWIGESGSGKTRALRKAVASSGFERVLEAAVAGKSKRSNPATYVGMWETMRGLLAATEEAVLRGLTPRSFSLAVAAGRCEACKGVGSESVSLGDAAPVVSTCSVCSGRRFASDVLQVRWKGRNAYELLELSVQAARSLLGAHPVLEARLRALDRAGLGYLKLGQPLHTLSGGEATRLALARELARAPRTGLGDSLVVLDDAGSGLHPHDADALGRLLRELVGEGATVWITTTNPWLISHAQWVIVPVA